MIVSEENINEQSLTDELKSIARRLGLREADEALSFPKYFQI